MTAPRVAAMLLSLLILAGCGAPAAQVTTEFDRSADFARYKTFAWHPQGMTSTGIPIQRAQFAQGAIKAAVDRELSQRGFKPATYSKPDFFIVSTVGAVNATHVRRWAKAEGGFTQTPSEVPLDTVTTREGSLVLDFVDNESNRLLWRGVAHAVAQPSDDLKQRIDNTVKAMLANFPPR